jgi:hypothetical protein
MRYSKHFLELCAEIDQLMSSFPHTKKDIGYGYRRTFTNGQRVDMIDYEKKGIHIFRVGRGAWFVRKYPLLRGLFDEVAKVITKIEIRDADVFHDKNFI